MNQWKTITTITLGAALLGASALAQTNSQPSTGVGHSAGSSPASDSAKVPAVAQPGGTIQSGDTAKTPPMSQSSSSKSKTMTKDTTSSGAAMKGERVRSVQEALKSKGYHPGPVDGVFGPKAKAALKDFQKAEQLPESGRQDPPTLAKLGVQ